MLYPSEHSTTPTSTHTTPTLYLHAPPTTALSLSSTQSTTAFTPILTPFTSGTANDISPSPKYRANNTLPNRLTLWGITNWYVVRCLHNDLTYLSIHPVPNSLFSFFPSSSVYLCATTSVPFFINGFVTPTRTCKAKVLYFTKKTHSWIRRVNSYERTITHESNEQFCIIWYTNQRLSSDINVPHISGLMRHVNTQPLPSSPRFQAYTYQWHLIFYPLPCTYPTEFRYIQRGEWRGTWVCVCTTLYNDMSDLHIDVLYAVIPTSRSTSYANVINWM